MLAWLCGVLSMAQSSRQLSCPARVLSPTALLTYEEHCVCGAYWY
jgi:hypothetical protein